MRPEAVTPIPGGTSSRRGTVVVSAVPPDPGGTGAEQRAASWLHDDAADGSDRVLLYVGPPAPPTIPGNNRVIDLSDLVTVPRRWHRVAGQLIPPLALLSPGFRLEAPRVPASATTELRDRLTGLGARELVAFRLSTAGLALQVADLIGAEVRCLDLDDLESRTRLSVARAALLTGNPARAGREWAAGAQAALLQRRLAPQFGQLALASATDGEEAAARWGVPVRHRPNPLPRGGSGPPRLPRSGSRLLFVGHLGYPPNEAAVRWIVRDLLPALERAELVVSVDVVGRSPSPRVRRWAATNPRVVLHPDPNDLAPFYARAAAVLVPVRHGGGTKIKTLEAVVHGVPLISTEHGARGLALEDGRHYLHAETTPEWVAAVAQVLRSPEDGARLADAARSLLG